MKSWDYYNLKGVHAFHKGFARFYLIRKRLVEKIKSKPIAESQRNKLISQATKRAQKIAQRANRAFYAERTKRLNELKIDQREAIGYNDLPVSTLETIESKAWEEGHEHGLSEVYYNIQELVAFTREIISQHVASTEGN